MPLPTSVQRGNKMRERKSINKCYLCDNDDIIVHDEHTWCKRCMHGQSIYAFDKSVYDYDYATEYLKRANSYMSTTLNAFRLEFTLGATKDIPLPKMRLLDFGCAAGVFVAALKFRISGNIKAYGYDVNVSHEDRWEDTAKFLFTDLSKVPQPLNVITFFDSLEHVEDPKGLIKYLDPRYVITSIPVFSPSGKNLTKSRHYKPVEHLHYFSTASIKKMLRDLGYSTVDTSSKESSLGRDNIQTFAFRKK